MSEPSRVLPEQVSKHILRLQRIVDHIAATCLLGYLGRLNQALELDASDLHPPHVRQQQDRNDGYHM